MGRAEPLHTTWHPRLKRTHVQTQLPVLGTDGDLLELEIEVPGGSLGLVGVRVRVRVSMPKAAESESATLGKQAPGRRHRRSTEA